MRVLLLALISIQLLAFSYARGQFNFQRTYGLSDINEAKVVRPAVDGGFVIAGTTSINNTDIYILKINDDGTLNWQNTLGSLGIDHANAMTKSYDSCYVLAGYSNSFNGLGDYNIYVVKVDNNGQLLWHKEIGGLDWDFGYCIQPTQDSGYIIVGNSYSGSSGSSDGIFLKIDSLGNLQWERIFNTPGNDYLFGVTILPDGSYIANGTMINGNGGSKDIIIEKVNMAGDSIWFKEYGSNDDEESNTIYSKNGVCIIAGSNKDSSGLNNLTFRINDNGDSLSTTLLSHPNDEITTAIDTSNSNYIITGYTSSFGGGKKDLFISRIDSLGNDIQGKTYGGSEDEIGYSIIGTPDGGAIAVGSSTTYTPGSQSVYIVKADSNLIANTNVVIGLSEVDNKLKVFTAFSDPISHILTISCDPLYKNIDKLNLVIFDQNGKIVFYKNSPSNYKIPFNMENYLPGIYLIKITDNEGLSVMIKFLLL